MDNVHEGHRERLRERFIAEGLNGFDDHQVLELLLTYVIPRGDINPTAHALITMFGSLGGVLSADARDIMRVDGIGERGAVFLSMIYDITRRVQSENRHGRPQLKTPQAAGEYATNLLWRFKNEALCVICLDSAKRVLHSEKLPEGTVGETVIYPRQVVEIAIRSGAKSLILAHNHPSGDTTPSKNDIETTEKIRSALEPIGIALIDHIIVGDSCFFSFLKASTFDIDGTETATAALVVAEPY